LNQTHLSFGGRSRSYATCRVDSIQAAKKLLLNAEPKFPKEPAIKSNLACHFSQTGDIQAAKNYLKKRLRSIRIGEWQR